LDRRKTRGCRPPQIPSQLRCAWFAAFTTRAEVIRSRRRFSAVLEAADGVFSLRLGAGGGPMKSGVRARRMVTMICRSTVAPPTFAEPSPTPCQLPKQLACRKCGGPFLGRQGRFVLKNFLVDRPVRRALGRAVASRACCASISLVANSCARTFGHSGLRNG
jgi:hypothetical protein